MNITRINYANIQGLGEEFNRFNLRFLLGHPGKNVQYLVAYV